MGMSSNTTDGEAAQGEATGNLKEPAKGIDRPRLTPQGRTDPGGRGRDGTGPELREGSGQPDPAEG